MFLKNSRYAKTRTLTTRDSQNRPVTALRLRRLPEIEGEPVMVTNGSQLDVMSKQYYRDATRFWHIADANSELQANALVKTSGRLVRKPKT